MKKLIAILLTAAILLTTVAATPDTNTEREADIFDTLEILKHLADIHPNKAAELFGREDFTIFDVLSILKGLIGLDEAVRVYAWLKPIVRTTTTAERTTVVETTTPPTIICNCYYCNPQSIVGEEIEFHVAGYDYLWRYYFERETPAIFVAQSFEELQNIIKDEEDAKVTNPGSSRLDHLMLNVDESDFENQVAIIIYPQGISGMFREIVGSLEKNGNTLTVAKITGKTCTETADVVRWRIVLMVDRADFEGVNEVKFKSYSNWDDWRRFAWHKFCNLCMVYECYRDMKIWLDDWVEFKSIRR